MYSCSAYLIQQLEHWGVEQVFGIPGVHTIELYRGLEQSRIRHITPRHEQGAGFMADGYARTTGKPGVCFIITGPGMSNILTAMGQALADSIPMLVISSVGRRDTLGSQQGRLHELHSQQALVSQVARFSQTILDPLQLPQALERAMAIFNSGRPGPVHIEIPIDLLTATIDTPLLPLPRFYPAGAHPQAVAECATLLLEAKRPLVLVGGGCAANADAVLRLAETLNAPVITTINAKGILPGSIGQSHPLDIGANAAFTAVRTYAAQADVILALGTELGETDYDVVFDDGFRLQGKLLRVDIDAAQLVGNQRPHLALVSDAGEFARALLVHFPNTLPHNGAHTVAQLRAELALERDPAFSPFYPLYTALETHLPHATLVGDSTATVYAGNHIVSLPKARHYFNASTGYGTLGYALPAALGAKLGRPHSPVVALMGDGGIMFTVAELSTMVDEQLNIVVLIWNNTGYDEIRRAMDKASVARIGVNVPPPDFAALSHSVRAAYQRVHNPAELGQQLQGWTQTAPLIIEIDAHAWAQSL